MVIISVLTRLYNRMIEGQMERARREIALHSHLLPQELEVFGNRLGDHPTQSTRCARHQRDLAIQPKACSNIDGGSPGIHAAHHPAICPPSSGKALA